MCQKGDKTLNVHHLFYVNGFDPWEYPNYMLGTLCSECHKIVKNIDFKTELSLFILGYDKYPQKNRIEIDPFEILRTCYSCGKLEDDLINSVDMIRSGIMVNKEDVE